MKSQGKIIKMPEAVAEFTFDEGFEQFANMEPQEAPPPETCNYN